MKKYHYFFILSLTIFSLNITAKNDLTENNLTDIAKVVQTFKEAAHYFDAMLKFHALLTIYNQKYDAQTPEIICKFCPKRSLPCDELLVKVQAKAMDKAIGAKDSIANKARKKMLSIYYEIIRLFYSGSLENIRNYMAKIAQENEIPCEDCQKVEWKAEGVIKTKKHHIL